MENDSIVNTRIVTVLEISSMDSNEFVGLMEVFSKKDINDIDSWHHLKEVRIPTIQSTTELFIGVNVPKAMNSLPVVNSVNNGPYAVRTIIGWTVNG